MINATLYPPIFVPIQFKKNTKHSYTTTYINKHVDIHVIIREFFGGCLKYEIMLW